MSPRHIELHPRHELRESSFAREPAHSHASADTCQIGTGFFDVELFFDPKHRYQARFVNKVSEETFDLEFRLFQAWFDEEEVSSSDLNFLGVEARGSSDVASVTAQYTGKWFDAEVTYVAQRGDHVLQKHLTFRNLRKSACLRRLSLFTHNLSKKYEAVLHEGGMYYPIMFCRARKGGLFFCADFPCYFATLSSNTFRFDYYPGSLLEPGLSFQSLTAIVGVYRLTGRVYINPYHEKGAPLDAGERQWFREYLNRGLAPSRFPYLELKGPEPGAEGPSDLEILEQCAWLGVRHVLLPRMQASADAYPALTHAKRRMRENGINARFMWSRGDTENLRWLSMQWDEGSELPESRAYFAVDAFREYLVEQHLAAMERHGFREVEVTGVPIVPYYSVRGSQPEQAHRKEMLHQAFQGFADVAAALKENFGHVSVAGAYSCYGAGLVRLFDWVSSAAEPHPLPIPDIHVGRLYADMERLRFRYLYDFLVPKAFVCNSIGFPHDARDRAPYPGAEQYFWYLYHDRVGWRYALLSAIATGLRHRLYPLPMDLSEEDRSFAQKWLTWEKTHAAELRELEIIPDEPKLVHVDGYSYTRADKALVFLFNNSYDPQTVLIQLRLEREEDYLVRELYPQEMNYLGPFQGFFRKNSAVKVSLGPREAKLVEAVRAPASGKNRRILVFGAATVSTEPALVVRGAPGQRRTVGVRRGEVFLTRDVRFQGKPVSPHIKRWIYAVRRYEDGRETLSGGGFEGKAVTSGAGIMRDVWLSARFNLPGELESYLDCSPFRLCRPCWTYDKRLFFVVRFEPTPVFDAIRTGSEVEEIPESYWPEQRMKWGIDLSTLNLGLKAWINGRQCAVHPALASWRRLAPNPNPVVAYFFEAGSRITFGAINRVVLFCRQFDAASFRGIVMEHLPERLVEHTLDLP